MTNVDDTLFLCSNINKYVNKIIEVKGIKEPIETTIKLTKSRLKNAVDRVYDAIALDIDGTLTNKNDGQISSEIFDKIRELLNKGVYIILITGREKNEVEPIIKNILEIEKEPNQRSLDSLCWSYLLTIIGHGCSLLVPKLTENLEFSCEYLLTPDDSHIKELYQLLCKDFGVKMEIEKPVPCGVRLRLKNDYFHEKDEIIQKLKKWCVEHEEKFITRGFHLIKSMHKKGEIFQISIADKGYALNTLYSKYGFHDVPILRIGDQGQEGGNDYSLLDSSYGFSVNEYSTIPSRCFPVVNRREQIIEGPKATLTILNSIQSIRRIAVPPIVVEALKDEYISKIFKLKKKSMEASNALIDQWADNANSFFTEHYNYRLEFFELFDKKSGAISFQIYKWKTLVDSELKRLFSDESGIIELQDTEKLKHTAPLKEILESLVLKEVEEDLSDAEKAFKSIIKRTLKGNNRKYKAKRYMFTDTKYILRGSSYYMWYEFPHTVKLFEDFIIECLTLTNRLTIIKGLLLNKIKNYSNWKLALGFLDNLRNLYLGIHNALFQCANLRTNSKPYWTTLFIRFEENTKLCLELYYKFLLLDFKGLDKNIKKLIELKKNILDIKNNHKLIYEFLKGIGIETNNIIQRWRALDHPGFIYASVHLAFENHLKEIFQNIGEDKNICALGIMNGGIELPFVLGLIAKRELNRNINIALIGGISYYSHANLKSMKATLSLIELEDLIPNRRMLEEIMKQGDIVIPLDENIMTGRTLQFIRYSLIENGFKVPRMVCARYPGEGRLNQMMMEGHGGPDPRLLGKEIVGLVEEAPYSRIFTEEKEKGIYKDVTGIFDLSRSRIERYLKKNSLMKRK